MVLGGLKFLVSEVPLYRSGTINSKPAEHKATWSTSTHPERLFGSEISASASRTFGFRVWGLGFRVQGLGFRV